MPIWPSPGRGGQLTLAWTSFTAFVRCRLKCAISGAPPRLLPVHLVAGVHECLEPNSMCSAGRKPWWAPQSPGVPAGSTRWS